MHSYTVFQFSPDLVIIMGDSWKMHMVRRIPPQNPTFVTPRLEGGEEGGGGGRGWGFFLMSGDVLECYSQAGLKRLLETLA